MKAAPYLWTVQFFRSLSDNELSLELDGEHTNPDIYENLSVCQSYVILWPRNMQNGELCNIIICLYGCNFFSEIFLLLSNKIKSSKMRRRMCFPGIHSGISFFVQKNEVGDFFSHWYQFECVIHMVARYFNLLKHILSGCMLFYFLAVSK